MSKLAEQIIKKAAQGKAADVQTITEKALYQKAGILIREEKKKVVAQAFAK